MEVRKSTTAFRVLGLLNIQCLRDSIETVVNRHESLRTRFVVVDAEPEQKIDLIRDFKIEIVDLSRTVRGRIESSAHEIATAFLNQSVHLSVGPLFEAKLLRISTHEHILILAISHMVTDGGSVRILVEEIWSLYLSAIYNQKISLPALPIQYDTMRSGKNATTMLGECDTRRIGISICPELRDSYLRHQVGMALPVNG